VTINGKALINSNVTAIMYNNPMKIELSMFNDNDTLEIFYWTDHGSERQKWQFIFKDSTNSTLYTFTNSVDSSLGKTFAWRKNSISFGVGYLRKLFNQGHIKKIFVQFRPENTSEQDLYAGKNLCIVSID
jgi:hypothetical protein